MAKNKESNDATPDFPVVGLGASAGGLEALNAFFDAMPSKSGMAFVVVQHLSPTQDSVLHEIIQRHTQMPVQSILDDMPIQPNHVYVLSAGNIVTIVQNHLHLAHMGESHGWPETINLFFQSLAEDRHQKAVALVFSGAGHDGKEGAEAIKQQGGLVIAQDLESAIQSSMPFNVIDASLADAVLSPLLMPNYVLSHFEISITPSYQLEDLTETISDDDLKLVIQHIHQQTSYDFSEYKVSTLRRQVARRMGAYQCNTVNAYLDIMTKQVSEAQQLLKGLLIHVTSFFRDPEAFDALKTVALLPLLKTLSIDHMFRIWIPGCSTGEEAVSITILIYECLRELNISEMEVRVFATDINRDLVHFARRGLYPVAIAENITPERLKDHFIKVDDGYQVRTHISRMIVWAEHNLIGHPPFSNLYLISCRNVLIYFQPKLQERIRALFQFALRPEAILFLGSSETVPEIMDIFTVINSKQKIYRRTATSSHQWMRLDQPLFAKILANEDKPMTSPKTLPINKDDHTLRVIKDMLLEHYNSTCVIVDERYYVRYTYGEIDRYLRVVAGGEIWHSILSMAREGLDSELTIALYEAFETNGIVIRKGIVVKTSTDERLINVIVKPIQDIVMGSRYKLIIFEPSLAHTELPDVSGENNDSAENVTINRLREELQQTRQALQSATHALQAKNEELTSTMEEISSANEEVQTTNEELRTSKEELESMNEELNTVNTQLANQNYELTHANNALYNFLQSTTMAVIFLDQNLAIREFTQTVTRIFGLRKGDVGRPISEVTTQLIYNDLTTDATHVLDTLINIEKEVTSTMGEWYQVEIRLYSTMNNLIDGLVLTFTDISKQKQAQHDAEASAIYIRKVVDTIDNSLLELDSDLHVVAANPAFYQQFEVEADETIGKLLYDLGNGQWDIPDLRRLLQDIISRQVVVHDYNITHNFPKIGKRTMRINANQIKEMNRILLVITDVSP